MIRFTILLILFTASWCYQDAVASEKYGGIGFPSGPVKDSELVNLLLGNTLLFDSRNAGLITRYLKKGGETKICVREWG